MKGATQWIYSGSFTKICKWRRWGVIGLCKGMLRIVEKKYVKREEGEGFV